MFTKTASGKHITAVTSSQLAVTAGLSTATEDPPTHSEGPPQRFADRLADQGTKRHAALAAASVVAAAYIVMAGVMIMCGLVLTHLLPSATHWDEHVNVVVAAHRTSGLTALAHWGTWIANTLGVVVVATAVTVLYALRRSLRGAMLLPAGLVLELAVFLTANQVVARPRPAVAHLGSTPSTYSFPSGHSAATLVLYGGIAVLVTAATTSRAARAVAWTAAILLPLWVSFARVYEGQHHPFDVLAGLAMGLAALTAAVIATRAAIRSGFAGSTAVTTASHAGTTRSAYRAAERVAPTIGVEQ